MKKCPTCVDKVTQIRMEEDVGYDPSGSGTLMVYGYYEVPYEVEMPVTYNDSIVLCVRCGNRLVPA